MRCVHVSHPLVREWGGLTSENAPVFSDPTRAAERLSLSLSVSLLRSPHMYVASDIRFRLAGNYGPPASGGTHDPSPMD